MFLLLCTTNMKRMSHVHRHNRSPLQGVCTVFPASICTHSAKLDVELILLCLQRGFSTLDTYFYMKIKFPACWFSSCSLRRKDTRFPDKVRHNTTRSVVIVCKDRRASILFVSTWHNSSPVLCFFFLFYQLQRKIFVSLAAQSSGTSRNPTTSCVCPVSGAGQVVCSGFTRAHNHNSVVQFQPGTCAACHTSNCCFDSDIRNGFPASVRFAIFVHTEAFIPSWSAEKYQLVTVCMDKGAWPSMLSLPRRWCWKWQGPQYRATVSFHW